MARKYSAFISYKHAKEDSKIAAHIQRKLERFTIPRKVAKETGYKRIGRIFRDKEELPLTNDLTATLTGALDNADNLIVICSPETKKSVWVEREIEHFLSKHSRLNVYTVLVSGEPADVVPEILLYDEVEKVDEDGNTYKEKVEVEALACDFRFPLKVADKKELPRLVSAIIGCEYDKLMNRIKRYKTQRIIALLSVILTVTVAFGGYLFYSMRRFKEAYLESLRNESQILSQSSNQSRANDERLDALRYALEAVPDENPDRPVIPEAVDALSTAVLPYYPNGHEDIAPSWNYTFENAVKEYKLSPDGNTLVATTVTNDVYFINVKTHKTILELPTFGAEVYQVVIPDDNTVVISYSPNILRAYSISKAKLIWENTDYKTDDTYYQQPVQIYDDTRISFGGYLYDEKDVLNMSAGVIDLIDFKTGKAEHVICDNHYNKDIPSEYSDYLIPSEIIVDNAKIGNFSAYYFSPDKDKIAFISYTEILNYSIIVYDIKSQTLSDNFVLGNGAIDCMWFDNNTLYISYVDSSTKTTGINLEYMAYISGPTVKSIYCIDTSTMEEIWNTSFSTYEKDYVSGFIRNGYTDNIGFYSSNLYSEFDPSSGKIINSYDALDSILYVNADDNGMNGFITTTGNYCIPDKDNSRVYYKSTFQNDITYAHCSNTHFFVSKDNGAEIIEYSTEVRNDDYKLATGDNLFPNRILSTYVYDEYMAVLVNDVNEAFYIELVDCNKNKVKEVYSFNKFFYSSYTEIIKMDDEYIYFVYSCDGSELLSEDLVLGKIEYRKKGCPVTEEVIGGDAMFSYNDNKIIFKNKIDYGIYTLNIYDMNTGKTKEITSDKYSFNFEYDTPLVPTYLSTANAVIFTDYDGTIIYHFLKSGKEKELDLPDNWIGLKCFAESEELNIAALSDGPHLAILNSEGNVDGVIDTKGKNVTGISYYYDNSSLVVLYSDSTLSRYSLDDYSLIETTKLYGNRIFNESDVATFTYVEEDNLLMVETPNRIRIVDTENWYGIGQVYSAIAYVPDMDRFFVKIENRSFQFQIAYYEHYSLEDLIEMAHDYLGE